MFYPSLLSSYMDRHAVNTNDLPPDLLEMVPLFTHTTPGLVPGKAECRHVYLHQSVASLMGYQPDHFGLQPADMYLDKLPPRTFEIFQKKIFPINMHYLRQVSPEKAAGLIFSHTFKIQVSKGHHTSFLQRNSFLVSPTGMPLATVGHIYDISPYKKDNSIVHVIEDPAAPAHEKIVLERHYHPDAEDFLLSRRELEILKCIAEGLSSKQIAGKTGISVNTVNNHRNRMLQKTNCRNSYELIIYGVKHFLL